VDPAELDSHFPDLLDALEDGGVVPLLGAGANLSGRPSGWTEGSNFLPSGEELAKYLAQRYKFDEDDTELIRVSQFVALQGAGPLGLYRLLHKVFRGEHEPGHVHKLLAAIPGTFRARGQEPRYQLILTTNYDRALEAAFDEVGERYHLLWYVSEGPDTGKFKHRAPGAGEAKPIEEPNDSDVSTEDCTVILKIHGGVGEAPGSDSYVITEDDYLDYLTHSTEIASLFPIHLLEQLLNANFLFLGYSLRDWNLRVILNRIWQEQPVRGGSWAIQRQPKALDSLFWKRHQVEILDIDLDEYVLELRRRLGLPEPAQPPIGARA